MRDFAKEVTKKGYKDGVAVIPYWQHELSMWKETDRTKKMIIATAVAVTLAVNMAWIITTKKH